MEIGRNGKGGRKKSSYWTRAVAWLQQLAPDVTMKLLINIPILRRVRCWLICSLMPLVGAPAVCLHASVISVGPAFSSGAFFLVFPGLLSSMCVCVCSQPVYFGFLRDRRFSGGVFRRSDFSVCVCVCVYTYALFGAP